MAAIKRHALGRNEQRVLMTVAAMHAEFGHDCQFSTDAVDHVDGHACVGELGMLALFGMVEQLPDGDGVIGYRLTPTGFGVLPECSVKRRLSEHREETTQVLREEQ